ILSRGNVDDLVDEILIGLANSDADSLVAYLPIVAEKRIAGGFEVIKNLEAELIADSVRQVLATAYTLRPDETVEWATAEIMKTQDSRVFFGFCDMLHGFGIDLAATLGFVDLVRELFCE